MKTFTLNMGWRGGIVILAASREEAWEVLLQNAELSHLSNIWDRVPSMEDLEEETENFIRFHGDE